MGARRNKIIGSIAVTALVAGLLTIWPGAANALPVEKTIAEIQGSGDTSPEAGNAVTIKGVVTAAYPTGNLRGYTIQTAGTGGELDPAAHTGSDGLFVFSSSTVGSVNLGDFVRVSGTVSEFNGLTELTVTAAADLAVLTEPHDPVTPALLAWPGPAQREALESMLYQPTGNFTVTNTFSTNRFGEVGLAVGERPLIQPTDQARPNSDEANAVIADNAARGVVLDDGATTDFTSAANSSQTPPYVSLTDPVRVGELAVFDDPVIVDYRNNTWKFNPRSQVTQADPAAYPATFKNDRTPAPDAPSIGAADLRIASFNVLNYFTTLGADVAGCTSFNDRAGHGISVDTCPGNGPRGAWDQASLQRQQDKIVHAVNGLDADVVGLSEIENSAVVSGAPVGGAPDAALDTLVDALNAQAGAGTWAYVPSSAELPPIAEMDVISNAIIYKPAAVQRTGAARALGTQSAEGQAFGNAREPIAQVFTPVDGAPFLFVMNHFKSKGSAGPWPGDVDTGDGQGASNESRVRQATALRDWVADVKGPATAVALVGDFNSYRNEDPLQVLYDAGYVDAENQFDLGKYSYSFSGLSGSLDHILLNDEAVQRSTGADIWNINSGESVALQYSRYNNHGTLFYDDSPYASSDHDPVVLGLERGTPPPAGPVDLTLLNINDFHGRIDANTVKFAGTVESERAAAQSAGGDAVLLAAGDSIGASLFASSVAQDQPTVDVLNALQLKASAVGNHEFDQGFDDLTGRVIDNGANARWKYLGANVYLKGTQTPALPEYEILDVSGVQVGVIGAVTGQTPSLVSPAGVQALDFGDPVAAVNRVAGQLADGNPANGEADVLVAEYHEGAGEGLPDGTLEDAVAAGGAFAAIVNETSPTVAAIFTGHTHQQYAWDGPVPGQPGRTRPILQTGSYGGNVGKIVLTVDRDTNAVTAYTATNVARVTTADDELVASYPRVAQVKGIVDAAIAAANVIGLTPVGSVDADITTAYTGGSFVNGVYAQPNPADAMIGRDDRSKESTLGNLVADSLVASLSSPERGGATIGVVNPGGLRNELFFAPDGGVVTYAEANAVLPFVNNLWTVTLSGARFKTLLEQQWQTNADGSSIPTRPYLQLGLSDNVTYTFDETRARGDHVTSITVDGAPLDPAASYRIGTFSFLTSGGDNFRVFTDGTDARDSGLIDRDAWIQYLQQNPHLTPDFARQAVATGGLPSTVTAGEPVSFSVSGLDLTSLGSPQNSALSITLGEQQIGTATVTGGRADIAVTVPAGTDPGPAELTLTAAPSGTAVTVPIEIQAPAPVTTVELTASAASQVFGSANRVTLTATVRSSAGQATGIVEFSSADGVLGSQPLVDGVATLRLPARTPPGALSITAHYRGSATVPAATSDPASVTVEKASSQTVLLASAKVFDRNGFVPVFLFAVVGLNNGQPARGAAQILRDGEVLDTVPVAGGLVLYRLPRSTGPGTVTFAVRFVASQPEFVNGSDSNGVRIRVR